MKKGAVHLSRLSSKGQVTLPKPVRQAIGVKSGDTIAYHVSEGVVTIRRMTPLDLAFHTSLERTLEEWASPEDDEAFGDL
jgi:AbrB family looped-hinge helix DNA binding protein